MKKIAKEEYKIKIINKEQVKIQAKNSIAYVKIIKELKNRETEFHTYKPKEERSFKVPHMHPLTSVDDIKKEIEEYDHSVINI